MNKMQGTKGKRMERRCLIALIAILIGLTVPACGGGGDDIDPDTVKVCQQACDQYVECDPKGDSTWSMGRDCKAACEDPSQSSELHMSDPVIDCYKLDVGCESFNACVNSIGQTSEGTPATWCEAWCRRCKECLEKQSGFGESMCKDGVEEICLANCAERYEGAEGSCVDSFNSFNPNQATCEEIDRENPFESGC